MKKILVIGICIIFMYFSACGKKEKINESIAVKKLEEIMNVDTIGIQREFFEKKYGPAKRLLGDILVYEIDSCTISIEYDKKNSITSVELANISKKCSFDGKNIPGLKSNSDGLTYAELIEVSMEWNAKLSCYTMCGNAFDPDFGAFIETPRVYGYIEFEATTDYSGSEASQNSVYEYFKIKYPDTELIGGELGSIPKDEYNKIWYENFKNVKLTSFKFGYNLQKQ